MAITKNKVIYASQKYKKHYRFHTPSQEKRTEWKSVFYILMRQRTHENPSESERLFLLQPFLALITFAVKSTQEVWEHPTFSYVTCWKSGFLRNSNQISMFTAYKFNLTFFRIGTFDRRGGQKRAVNGNGPIKSQRVPKDAHTSLESLHTCCSF